MNKQENKKKIIIKNKKKPKEISNIRLSKQKNKPNFLKKIYRERIKGYNQQSILKRLMQVVKVCRYYKNNIKDIKMIKDLLCKQKLPGEIDFFVIINF